MAVEASRTRRDAGEIDLEAIVRYVAGVLPAEDAAEVERAIVLNLRDAALLARVYRTVEELRHLALKSLKDANTDDDLTNEIRSLWAEIATSSLTPVERTSLTLAGLATLSRASREGARISRAIVTNLLDVSLAPKRPEMVAATRSRADLPHTQDLEFSTGDVQFSAKIDNAGALIVDVHVPLHPSASGRTLWIAFDLNRQWLGLGSALIQENQADFEVPGFGPLLGLSEGPLPPDLFAIRLDEWPSVCALGAFVVQAGSQPFAEVESDPEIGADMISVDIRLLPHSIDLKRASELELWFGTGGHVWQLLGRWPLPAEPEAKMTLRCPSPKPGLVGIAFPGVLKLALRP